MGKKLTKAELRNACWTTGLKPLGYAVHITHATVSGTIRTPYYRTAMAMQRAIRAALAANPGSK